MKDGYKTKEQLINELVRIRQQIAELRASEAQLKQTEEKLRQSEAKYRTLIEQIPAITYVDTLDAVTIYVSPQVEKMLGFSQSECLSGPNFWLKQLHPDDRERVQFEYHRSRAGSEPFASEYRLIARDGRVLWVRDEAMVVQDDTGQSHFIQGVILDITERKRAEEEIRKREEWFKLLADNIDGVFWISDPIINQILYVSPGYERIWGKTCKSLYESPRSWLDSIHPEDRNRVLEMALTKNASGEAYEEEFRIAQPNGSILWIRNRAFPIKNESGEVYRIAGIAVDITKHKQMEETIRNQAYYDNLTKLPNRLLFKERFILELAHAKRNKRMLAVMFLDLDKFKIINDTMGHDVGDRFLKIVSERLTSLLREDDTIARFGGDEFALLLPRINQLEDPIKVAQRIVETFQRPWIIDDRKFGITASIGIAIYPRDGENDEALLRNADVAMYQAKKMGKNQYRFYRDH